MNGRTGPRKNVALDVLQPMTFRVIIADITTLATDAIVNAANPSLLGGGGVDGAIHRAAGPGLLEECAALGGCAVGEAKISAGHKLPARYVIHTVGPVWRGGAFHEDDLLASAYRSSMQCAFQLRISTIAFPAISTGAFGFPAKRAAQIAVDAVQSSLSHCSHDIDEIVFCCFSEQSAGYHRQALIALRNTG